MWSFLILLAIVVAALHLVFLYFVRPLLIQKLRFIIFARRDELRLMALRKQIPETDKAYAMLESRLNICVRAIPSIDVADLLLIHPSKADELAAARSMQVIEESIPEVRAAFDAAMNCIVAAMLINSPVIFPILPVVVFAAVFIGRAKSMLRACATKAWAVSATPGLCPA